MLTYANLSGNPKDFLAMTGYTVEEFQALLGYFRSAFLTWMVTWTLSGEPRTGKAYSPYSNCPLPALEDKLLFILVYLKQYPTQTLLGQLFGMPQPVANIWLHRLHPVVNQALAAAHELPARAAAELSFERETDTTFFHDGTECPIPRPTDPELQKTCYSGKKKRHTQKYNLLSNAGSRVLFLSSPRPGSRHEKRIADEDAYSVPEGSTLYQDTGFEGFSLPGVCIVQPMKKPRGTALTTEQKAVNRRISRVRVRIEHVIGGVKRYRILTETIRNWKRGFRDLVMETCCGLHNFRLRFRPWTYPAPRNPGVCEKIGVGHPADAWRGSFKGPAGTRPVGMMMCTGVCMLEDATRCYDKML